MTRPLLSSATAQVRRELNGTGHSLSSHLVTTGWSPFCDGRRRLQQIVWRSVYTAKKGITRTAVVVVEREITDDTYPTKILVVAVSWCDNVEFWVPPLFPRTLLGKLNNSKCVFVRTGLSSVPKWTPADLLAQWLPTCGPRTASAFIYWIQTIKGL